MDVINAIPMQTEYQADRSPRISTGAISTIEIVPVTLRAPIPKPEMIRDAYSPDDPGLKMATICPIIQIMVYMR